MSQQGPGTEEGERGGRQGLERRAKKGSWGGGGQKQEILEINVVSYKFTIVNEIFFCLAQLSSLLLTTISI